MQSNNPSRNNISRAPSSPTVMKKGVNTFLTPAQTLAKRGVVYDDYDEPTYVGFYIKFDFTGPSTPLVPGNYDYMPEGLLGDATSPYSAENYLRSIDEHHRADMIKSFNAILQSISENTPYYIQEVEGLDSIFKINTDSNYRGKEAELKLKMLEGIDMRSTALIDLYKRVAWDSTWMRWILPDIHRYFSMRIYITEFRNFHVPRGKERSGAGKTDSSGAMAPNTSDSFGNAYNTPGGYPLNSAVQGYKDQLNDLKGTATDLTRGVGTIPSAARDRLGRGGDNEASASSHFLAALDRNLSVLILDLKQCEISLSEMSAPYGDSITNADTGEPLTQEITIKVGKIKEISEYSLLSVGLQGVLDSNDPTIRAGIFSDDAIDSNWSSGSANNTVSSTDGDLYNMITGEHSKSDIESSYNSANTPFGRGHLKNDNNKIRTLGENLIESVEDRLIAEADNFVRTYANKALLGNVYGLSASTLANRLSSDPYTWGSALVDIIKKTQGSENASAILSNIYSNLPDPSGNIGDDAGNAGLTGTDGNTDGNSGNIGLTGPSTTPSDVGNIGLTGPSTTPSDVGNIGLTGPSTTPSDVGNIGLTGPSTTPSDVGNVGLTGPEAVQSDVGNVGLTGHSINPVNMTNVGLSGNNISTQGTVSNVGLSGVEPSDSTLDNAGLTGTESRDEYPGNIGLSGKPEGPEEVIGNIGLTGAVLSDTVPTNIGLSGATNSIETEPSNIGLTGPVGAESSIATNIGLTGSSNKPADIGDVGLHGNDAKKDTLYNIGLTGDTTSLEMDSENIGYTGGIVDDNVLGNIGLTGTTQDTINLGNIGLTGADKQITRLDNIGLTGNNISNVIDENIGLTGSIPNKDNMGNINHDIEEARETDRPGNIGLSGDYLRTQLDESIGLTGAAVKTENLANKNIGLQGINKVDEDDNLGNINLSGGDVTVNDETPDNIGLTGTGSTIDDNAPLPNNRIGRMNSGPVE